jgi:hypothetical protein
LRFSLLAAVALFVVCTAPVSASRPFEIVARPANAIGVGVHGTDRVAFDARVGIGRAELRAPDGFPSEVSLRFPGFRYLERVRAVSGTRSLTCDLHRLENRATAHSCKAVGIAFDGALTQDERGFELVLPPDFAADVLSVEWVDQYR